MGKHSRDGQPAEDVRFVTVNVGPQGDYVDSYPGLGVGVHLLHLVLTFLTGGLWIFVWVIHALVARSKWNSQQRERGRGNVA